MAASTVAAAVLATWAGWLSVPAPPALSAERWFKTMVANVLLGQADAVGATGEVWEASVRDAVPFGEGEATRWSLTEDPALLGPDYDPAHWLGRACSWEAVARWEALPIELTRGAPPRWVVVRAPHAAAQVVVDALVAELGELVTAIELDHTDDPVRAGAWLSDAIELAVDAGRVVIVVEGLAAIAVVHALSANAALRDRVPAVLCVGGWPLGLPDAAGPWGDLAVRPWLARTFDHRTLDTELVGRTPWFAAYTAAQRPPELATYPQVTDDRADPWGVDPQRLGVLGTAPEHAQAVARALWLLVACWTASRAG